MKDVFHLIELEELIRKVESAEGNPKVLGDESMEDLILACLQKSRNRRPDDAERVLKEIVAASGDAPSGRGCGQSACPFCC